MTNKIILLDGGRSHSDYYSRYRIAEILPQQRSGLHHAVQAALKPSVDSADAGSESSQKGEPSGGGSEDDGGGGDSDEDGPRPPSSRTPHYRYILIDAPSPTGRRQSASFLNIHTPHCRALISLVLLTLALLAAALIFGLTGHEYLAAEAMGMACGLPRLARSLVKPK